MMVVSDMSPASVDMAIDSADMSAPDDMRAPSADMAPPAEDMAAPAPTACSETSSMTSGLVTTLAGDVQGLEEDNGAWAFKGIPFAKPPTGALRWRPPEPTGCFEQQPLPASDFGPKCPQLDRGGVTGDEDCLQLNVWAPSDYTAGTDLPVLFFIHGGGQIVGSASQTTIGMTHLYDGKLLAEQHDAVVVTAQYRLGALGFLATTALAGESGEDRSGNYAHMDQIAALEWVRDNISGFGGDPSRVMIFGESAGALNTCALVASPRASGLFHAALMQSAACTATPEATLRAEHDAAIAFFDECDAREDKLACLRELDAATIIETIPGSVSFGTARPDDGRGVRFGSVIDGHILTDDPLETIRSGAHNDVTFVVGSNADEMASDTLFPVTVGSTSEYEAYVRAATILYGADAPDRILAAYPADSYESPQDALEQLFTDAVFTCNARQTARVAAMASSSPVYRYFFSRRTTTRDGSESRAAHGIELLYVFGTLREIPFYTPPTEDAALSDAMMASWVALARDADPNDAELGVTWAPYTAEQDNYIDFGDEVTLGAGLRTSKCDLWDELNAR